LYFNYNSPITRKNVSSLTTAKGQWLEGLTSVHFRALKSDVPVRLQEAS